MIVENLAFGIDLGIGSCGWAVLQTPSAKDAPGAIPAIGSWIFDVPETDKERTPTNRKSTRQPIAAPRHPPPSQPDV